MNRFKQFLSEKTEQKITVLMALFFMVGILGHGLQMTRPLMLSLSPYFLFVFGLLAVYPVLKSSGTRMVLWMAVTLIATFALEAVGTATGVIFGPYTYGPTLGLSLFHVPVVIAFNWLIVILAALILSGSLFQNSFLTALTAGGIATIFDFILEPVAITLDYWRWDGGRIPVQNYIAWFVIAFIAAYSFKLLKLEIKNPRPGNYVLIQFVFFLGLRIVL
jgi:bisanhydrobacterioruberin hydratase